MRVDRLAARFVEDVPELLEPGQVYVSLKHATMVHLCACGCGCEVVLPLSPLDWRFTWNGEQMSVSPSVGSWSLPCRSHYIIDCGRVRWAGDWSDDMIQAGRDRDRRLKGRHFGEDLVQDSILAPSTENRTVVAERVAPRRRWWLEWLRWIARWK